MLDPFLIGQRVHLRPFHTATDADALLRWWNHPLCRKHFACGAEPAARLKDLPFFDPRHSQRFSVVLAEGNLQVGVCCLHGLDPWQRRAELFVLVQPDWQRRHLALESAELLLRHAFEQLGVDLLAARLDERHQAGRQLAARLGFEPMAVLPKWNLRSGRRTDEIVLSLTRARMEQLEGGKANPWSN